MDNNTIEQLQKILELEFANVTRITVKEALFCRTPKQPAMVLFAAHESLKDYPKLIRHAVDMVYLFAQKNIISCEIDIILTPNNSSINPQINNRSTGWLACWFDLESLNNPINENITTQ